MRRSEELLFPRRKQRVEESRHEQDQRKLLDEFFDHSTLLTISRLVTQGQFDSLDFPVSTGKEGGVFRASAGDEFRAVKVYRIGNTVFRHLPAYTQEALRRETSARNFAGLVSAWTRREHTTLRRLKASEVRVPTPFGYLRNVLVMEFIGSGGMAAPRLRDALVDDPEALYRDLTDQIRKMVVGARLVHGDLSPYNVLFEAGAPVLIDVAQSIPAEHPQAAGLLRRDVKNFATFLRKLGADVDPEEFFRAVGGPTVSRPKGE